MPTWNHIMLQDSASPIMEQLIFFHDHTLTTLILVTIFISYMMINSLVNSTLNKFLLQGQEIETIWTIIPALILILITIPSLRILYLMEEAMAPMLTIKTIGHQWYWSYEYSDFKDIEFDSFMIPLNEMNLNSPRLLEVDNRLVIPMNTSTRILTTATDVIHAWSIPSLGVKMDSIPGRINQSTIMSWRPGILTGQCSEICGANHSFMPIILETVNMKTFSSWILNKE